VSSAKAAEKAEPVTTHDTASAKAIAKRFISHLNSAVENARRRRRVPSMTVERPACRSSSAPRRCYGGGNESADKGRGCRTRCRDQRFRRAALAPYYTG